jgi:regulator of sirC expression with transglutaminase-like and TPR domain
MTHGAATDFASIVDRSDADLNLAESALLIALGEYPDLDPGPYLARLDEFADEIRSRATPDSDMPDVIRVLNQYLFVDQGFGGNLRDYGDPRNSFLNEVLDRKLGIPISLSVVYLEVAWRLDLPFEGVSFPGHFLVKCPYRGGQIVLDPFLKGISLGAEDLRDRVRRLVEGRHDMEGPLEQWLAGASKRAILLRMLRNLRIHYVNRNRHDRALEFADQAVLLAPDEADEIRARADIYHALECFRAALDDYRRYLILRPEGHDIIHVQNRIVEMEQAATRLN